MYRKKSPRDPRGRKDRKTKSPEACLQAYWWARDGTPTRWIAHDLQRPGREPGWPVKRRTEDAPPAHLLDQAWHRTVQRYVEDGEALWNAGEWEIIFEMTIETGVVDPQTGAKEGGRAAVHRVFQRKNERA